MRGTSLGLTLAALGAFAQPVLATDMPWEGPNPALRQSPPSDLQPRSRRVSIAAPASQTTQALPVEIFANSNPDGVGNGGHPPWFSLERPTRITYLLTYHWNFGQGRSPPGEISLISESGRRLGPWRAVGQPGQGGVPDAYWIINPGILLPAGRYQVTDSDPPTWAQNAGSHGEGIVIIKGVPQ